MFKYQALNILSLAGWRVDQEVREGGGRSRGRQEGEGETEVESSLITWSTPPPPPINNAVQLNPSENIMEKNKSVNFFIRSYDVKWEERKALNFQI